MGHRACGRVTLTVPPGLCALPNSEPDFMKKHKERKVKDSPEALTPKKLHKIIQDGGKMILQPGQAVTLLKEEGDRVLILPDGSDTAYRMSRDDIRY